ncbi:beta-lactoglobulin I [Paraburkholderia dipogonis]|uniref:Beta-lactoglobulin I n=1 Tax=Paraburkholderia dipogonis TaxID=1211383 RepID=A0A4Y8N1C6_9BURK|nr:beta-lactoglobulin I [Paraburkholderia dipogonis]TFE43590.1 beta-lactoglobulin I [Paraburkholderia dipogonis]
MMTYAIFTPDGTPLAYMTTAVPPTIEQMADHCAEVHGFADRDEWMMVQNIAQIAYAPVH